MILWSKGKLVPKMGMKAIIATVAAMVVATSVGFISLASHTTTQVSGLNTFGGLGGCNFQPG